jgi:phosphopantetheinyl transferase
MVFAFSCGREVVIDLERIRPELDHHGLVARFFITREKKSLRTLLTDE